MSSTPHDLITAYDEPDDLVHRDDNGSDIDAETASQRSIPLSSPPHSPHGVTTPLRAQEFFARRGSQPDSIEIDFGSETDEVSDSHSDLDARRASSITSAAPSTFSQPELPKINTTSVTYPPVSSSDTTDVDSFTSAASTYSRKARPESMLLQPPHGPLVLGIALVDFNHLVGPKIEFSQGDIFEDEEIAKVLPFLALPDGAHLSLEDYSYFHLVPDVSNPTTIFGISCNRQIAASTLLVKDVDVTRSTVQKAVVVLASKPVFGPIRSVGRMCQCATLINQHSDRLGVVTRALFAQRDFTDTQILVEFGNSLEMSLRTQLTESGLYIGLREFVHAFRHRTLVLLKALMLQKKILFYGHPVERLCTYQYSLISLIPSLLQTLDDCGSPPLAARAPTLSRPNSLKTSDRKSMLAYIGLPLDLFGKDAFFQPYLPLQQLDLLKDSQSWLCGSTNTIVTQQKEIDLLVNTETATLEFRNPKLERLVTLTPADRKWVDEIVRDVNDSWDDTDPTKTVMHFKGSDDYLRAKFEEYVSAALASVRYREFLLKGNGNGTIIAGTGRLVVANARFEAHFIPGGDATTLEDFSTVWIAGFTKTNAYEVWDRSTDPLLFDIVEPRHPCNEKPSVVSDIGLRLSEGIQDLKLEQQLAPTREAISRTLTAGSANFFKAVEGVRERWQQRAVSSPSMQDMTSSPYGAPVEITKSEVSLPTAISDSTTPGINTNRQTSRDSATSALSPPRPVSMAQAASDTKAALSSLGAGIQSLWSNRASRLSLSRASIASVTSNDSASSPTLAQQQGNSFSTAQTSPPKSRPSVHTVVEVVEHGQEQEHFVVTDLSDESASHETQSGEPMGTAL
ncbi:transport protein Avl9-domain-containing protein [Lanmaoa asiatica]|nr:transport protein Avl9-domain-containing protein [Lanmaoa asiatica]